LSGSTFELNIREGVRMHTLLTRIIVILGCLALGLGLMGPVESAKAEKQRHEIDTGHSGINFKVRHFFTKTPGRFTDFSGVLIWDTEDPAKSTVEATIQAASIDTNSEDRDGHLKGEEFLWVEKHPTITFKSTSVKALGDNTYEVTGDFTMRGVTKPVTLEMEHLGSGQDPWGGYRSGFTATTEIDRTEFGVEWNKALEGGGLTLGKKVEVGIEVEAVLSTEEG
jgi:polyisoprenoid-binding protein YceI